MNKFKLVTFLTLMLTLLLTVTACGGEDTEAKKDEFITKANGICKTANEKVTQAKASSRSSVDDRLAQAEALGTEEEALNQMVTDLEALEIPEDGKEEFTDYLAQVKEVIGILGPQKTAIEEREDVVGKGDLEAVKKYNDEIIEATKQTGQIKIEANKVARLYGVRECALEI